MPAHPDRVRSAPLPSGYQFGDALPVVLRDQWRAPHENAAEQLARLGVTANVIEGDHH